MIITAGIRVKVVRSGDDYEQEGTIVGFNISRFEPIGGNLCRRKVRTFTELDTEKLCLSVHLESVNVKCDFDASTYQCIIPNSEKITLLNGELLINNRQYKTDGIGITKHAYI